MIVHVMTFSMSRLNVSGNAGTVSMQGRNRSFREKEMICTDYFDPLSNSILFNRVLWEFTEEKLLVAE